MRIILFLIITLLISCNQKEKSLTAQQIIDKSIITSDASKVSNSEIFFKFRDKEYRALRNNGNFKLHRIFTQEKEVIEDVLSNNGFKRFLDGHQIKLPDSMARKYSSSVNSVHYFSVLPYGLNDAAVKKKLLDNVTIKGKSYYKIQISFSENGGGEDFEDVFIYWIDKQNFEIDYLAYSYHVNGGGMRFREVKNERLINGIRFVDYNNYKSTNASTKLKDLDKAFEKSKLKKISEINLEKVKVTLLN